MRGLRIPVRIGLLEHSGAIRNGVLAYAGETACMLAAVSLARSADSGLTEFRIEHVSPAYGDSLLVRATAALDEAQRVVTRSELFVARGDDEELCAVGYGSLAAPLVDSQVGGLIRGGLQ